MQNLQKSEHSTHLIQKNHLLSATYSVDCPGGTRSEGVPDKVLDLIEDKNLFVGICTKNERAAKGENFTPRLLSRSLAIEARSLEWKTSDWIIQEIGLAIGKGMKLILLLESGVRKPGGLFGDLEYIAFSKDRPEQAFKDLTGMISDLSKRAKVSQAGSQDIASDVSHSQSKNENESESNEPDASWSNGDFMFRHHIAVFSKDEELAERISTAYLDRVGEETAEGLKWSVRRMLDLLRWAKKGNISDIYAFADQHNSLPNVQYTAARAALLYNDNAKAKDYFLKAAEGESEPAAKVRLLGEVAALEQETASDTAYGQIVSLIMDDQTEKAALEKLEELEVRFSDNIFKTVMLERQVQIDPTNMQDRFRLAYLHSQNGNKELSLHHYLQIPANERNGITWNNLGVSYREFSMPEKSSAAYRNAIEEDETLAMSNLAHIYMDAGFTSEAKELLERARNHYDCHNNVAHAEVKLNEIPSAEDEELQKVLRSTGNLSEFYASVGNQVWQPKLASIPKYLKGSKFTLEAEIRGTEFHASGKEQVVSTGNALSGISTEQKGKPSA